MASVKKLPSGSWRALVRVRGFAPVSVTRRTKAAAEREAGRIENEMRNGRFVDASLAASLALSAHLDWYLAQLTPRKSETALKREASRVRVLQASAALRHCTLATLSPAAVLAFVDARRAAGNAAATVARDLSVLGNAIEAAVALRGVALPGGNPVNEARRALRHTKTLSVDDARSRRLEAGEEAALLAALAGNPVMQAAVRLLLETAMRREELCRARREDVEGDTLRIPLAKTGGRVVPLSPVAVQVLAGLPVRADGLLLGLRPDSLTQAFMRACRRVGIEGLRLHDLRHEAISRLFERGWSVAEVACVSGHADWRCLSRYTQIRPEFLAEKLKA